MEFEQYNVYWKVNDRNLTNYDGYLAQYTCIDGLELGPAYFAETDPLTGAWRPKKFVAEGITVNDKWNCIIFIYLMPLT